MNQFSCSGLDDAWYLYYYFRNPTSDYLSHQLMDFKGDYKEQVGLFSSLAAEACAALNTKFGFVTRVLGSAEITPLTNSRVRTIAKAIAEKTGALYIPNLLKKTRVTRSLKGLNRDDRYKELRGAYALNKEYDLNEKNLLLVDDISTTGCSFEVISEVICEKYPEVNIFGFCLAKTKSLYFDGVSHNPLEVEDQYREALKKIETK
jgi:predicted amidophosphoribosyltransferase